MLKKIKKFIKEASQQPAFDASKFNDSLASEIKWTPLKGGGSNFRTHKLVPVDYNRIEFKSTLGAKIFCSIFMGAGLAVPAGISIHSFQNSGQLFQSDFLFGILFGLIFMGVGGFMFYRFAKPVIFDKMRGMYWKGWKVPDHYSVRDTGKEISRISSIHAIQLLSEYVRSDKSSYYSYELNLVLKDGSRLNVVDHGNAAKLREDAKTLSEFLGKPVWDAVNVGKF